MPVLEAMAHGVPVVTSSRSALQEVAGDAALLIDPLTRTRRSRRKPASSWGCGAFRCDRPCAWGRRSSGCRCPRPDRQCLRVPTAQDSAGPTRIRAALGRSHRASTLARAANVRSVAGRVFQWRTPRASGLTVGPAGGNFYARPHELSPQTPAAPRIDPAHSENPSLLSHRLRPSRDRILHPHLRQDLPARTRHGVARNLSCSQHLTALFQQAATTDQLLGGSGSNGRLKLDPITTTFSP